MSVLTSPPLDKQSQSKTNKKKTLLMPRAALLVSPPLPQHPFNGAENLSVPQPFLSFFTLSPSPPLLVHRPSIPQCQQSGVRYGSGFQCSIRSAIDQLLAQMTGTSVGLVASSRLCCTESHLLSWMSSLKRRRTDGGAQRA